MTKKSVFTKKETIASQHPFAQKWRMPLFLCLIVFIIVSIGLISGCGGKSPAYTTTAEEPEVEWADEESPWGEEGAEEAAASEEAGGLTPGFGLSPMGTDELWIIAKNEQPAQPPLQIANGVPGLQAVLPHQPKAVPLPLEKTEVAAQIEAYIASVTVKQKYHNPYSEKIEAVYVFPLPQDAAVSEFVMTVGDRTIRGIIREREEAKRIYNQARSQGYVASLLTQERPNVFTQKVANIEPGKKIDIDLVYYNTLPYRDGAYHFTFPTVVGPRFNPLGTTNGIGAVGRGNSGASGQIAEVAYLKPGESSGHVVSFRVDINAGVSLGAIKSSSHDVVVTRKGENRASVTLSRGKALPNKDFRLRYQVAGQTTKAAFIEHRDGSGGYFTAVLTPPLDLSQMRRAPVEHVFVLDCSGSMSGGPLDTAKDAVRRVLKKLGPEDTFQIIRFSSRASKLGSHPVAATKRNVRKGLRYLNRLDSGGGTMMIEGLRAALNFPHEEGKVRIVTFMTDGYIGNETEILAAIKQNLGRSKIFSFGVGSSPNRYLLERMAKVGQGAVAYVSGGDYRADEAAVDAFFYRISHPALSDIEINWGGMAVSDVYPSRIPDLWSGRPVVITGKINGPVSNQVTLRGRVGGDAWSMPLPLDKDPGTGRPAIAQIWARMKILDLAEQTLWNRDNRELVNQIKSVALNYSLLSQFTAFIAVDSSRVTAGDHGVTVNQPALVPDGVRYETSVGGQ